jgi:lysophospholipase L1-like esterase
MKNILCFGDSNTFGYVPNVGERFAKGIRWTSVLSECLSDEYKVFEAGCNNRACFINHPDGDKFIGIKFIEKYIPYNIDIIITALGVNDIQKFFKPTRAEIEAGFDEYIQKLKTDFNAEIIVLAPPLVRESVLNGYFSFQFDKQSVEDSKLLPEIWENISQKYGCYFVNFNGEISVSDLDGLHYDSAEHHYIGEHLAEVVKKIS